MRFDSIYENSKNRKSDVFKFCYSNPNNRISLSAIYYYRKLISKDSLLIFYNSLDTINANSKFGKGIKIYSSITDVQNGELYREIVGKDLNGKEHKLSDYVGKKVVVLDFWASGCGPCRLQNKKEFPGLIRKYSKDDFILISFSFDVNKNHWIRASKRDNIHWLNLSDLKGQAGNLVTENYGVRGIPHTLIINKEGIIANTYVGYFEGENLIEKELDNLLL